MTTPDVMNLVKLSEEGEVAWFPKREFPKVRDVYEAIWLYEAELGDPLELIDKLDVGRVWKPSFSHDLWRAVAARLKSVWCRPDPEAAEDGYIRECDRHSKQAERYWRFDYP